jgi:hypothetical protein
MSRGTRTQKRGTGKSNRTGMKAICNAILLELFVVVIFLALLSLIRQSNSAAYAESDLFDSVSKTVNIHR